MTAPRKPLLEIRGLRTQFPLREGTVTALDGIDLTIHEKESVGIVGETGCGKSMTAFSVLRLVPPPGRITGGSVFFMEPDEVRKRRLEYEAEAQEWYNRKSPEERLRLVLEADRADQGRAKRRGAFAGVSVPEKPPERAPWSVVKRYLSTKAASLPKDDPVGRSAALCEYDLLTWSDDQMRAVRGKLSMIFQDPATSLDPVFTVGSQLAEVISLHQGVYDEKALERKVLEMLKLVRIAAPESVMKQYPHELSGGMKQRIMIALALSCSPSLLIADEPTTALDVTIQAQILNLLKDIVRKAGNSLMLITHNLGVVAETCDRVVIMYAGRVVEDADTFTLFERPLHPYTRGLLMAFPKLGERREELTVIRGTVPNLMKPFKGCSFAERCDFATDECRRVRPEMVEAEPGHFVACHLHRPGGGSV